MYRVNCIDFHELGTGVQVETIPLDFKMIPSQLHAENQEGIIRRTIEDQHREFNNDNEVPHSLDPKALQWSRVPRDAKIIGICETWESGNIDNRDVVGTASTITPESLVINDKTAYKFKACRHAIHSPFNAHGSNFQYSKSTDLGVSNGYEWENDYGDAWRDFDYPQWRLASGDVVRFAGLNTTSKHFNTATPCVVNIIDDGRAMLIESPLGIPQFMPFNEQEQNVDGYFSGNSNDTRWFNCKVWILYGKNDEHSEFKDWDMYLFNANTIDMHPETKSIKMADRTPPFTQARYYKSMSDDGTIDLALVGTSMGSEGVHPNSESKIYYPGDSMFILSEL